MAPLASIGAAGISTPFDVEADSAPALYVHGQPARTTAAVRSLEQAAARLTEPDLATGQTVPLTDYLADPVELKLLHMVTGDPKRTPSLVLFGNTDFWLSSGSASCGSSCVTETANTDAWNHGTVSPQINTTWLGLVGPGVAPGGVQQFDLVRPHRHPAHHDVPGSGCVTTTPRTDGCWTRS